MSQQRQQKSNQQISAKKVLRYLPPEPWPPWFNGQTIHEVIFCQDFLSKHALLYTEDAFFTPDGWTTDRYGSPLKKKATPSTQCWSPMRPPALSEENQQYHGPAAYYGLYNRLPAADRPHPVWQNGTLLLDGTFIPIKEVIVRSRFPVCYNENAGEPNVMA